MKNVITGILLFMSLTLYGQGIMLAVDPVGGGPTATVIEDTDFSGGQDGWSTTGSYDSRSNYFSIEKSQTISKSFDLSSYDSIEVVVTYRNSNYDSSSETLFDIETNLVGNWCITGCDAYSSVGNATATFWYTGTMDSSTFFEFEHTGNAFESGEFWLQGITITAY